MAKRGSTRGTCNMGWTLKKANRAVARPNHFLAETCNTLNTQAFDRDLKTHSLGK
jgi:hypothetical protein